MSAINQAGVVNSVLQACKNSLISAENVKSQVFRHRPWSSPTQICLKSSIRPTCKLSPIEFTVPICKDSGICQDLE